MKARLLLFAAGLAIAGFAVAVVPTDSIAGSCDIPLPIVRTVGEAKVLIIFDNSASMNAPLYHDDYDDTVTYPGNFTSDQVYLVSSDGNKTPKSFNNSWPNTPSAYLVDSDGGDDAWYDGNYLNWIYFTADATQRAQIPAVTRIQVAKQVVNSVIASASTNVAFGLQRFNFDNGGTLIAPMGSSVATLQAAVNGISADAYTPLAENMVDAMNYFKSTGASAPLKAACEKPFVLLVTDGHPTRDENVPAYLQDADGSGDAPGSCTSLGAPFPDSYKCTNYVEGVSYYLYRNDMRADLSGMQNITTYVVGFNITAPILQNVADFGGGLLYSARNTAQLTASLTQALAEIDKKVSAGTAVSVVSAEDQTNNRLYRARYESVSWRGFVESFALPYTTGNSPLWEAGALLQSRAPNTRTIYTSSTGLNKVNFTTGNAAALQVLLGAADVAAATNIIDYTRGTDLAGYRDRDDWKLGDVVDSSPITIGKPASFHDFLSYPAFRSANAGRTEVLYVGANDGMLHCFKASDGTESWAYVPKNQLSKLKDLMSPSYCHEYFVNMASAVYDIYINGSWKTVLIGGQERGGSGLFALDVTDPTPGNVSVLWDVNLPLLKGSWNRPALVRDKTLDKFVLAASTGLDSLTGQASILALDPANGSVLATYNLGSAVIPNMATAATVLDKDFDGYDDLLYVGDLAGRVWRVDVKTNPWTVAQLFSNAQPIQAAPALSMDEQGRVLVYFGTGKYLTNADLSTTSSQTIYGLFDTYSGPALTRASLVNQTNSITALTGADRGWYVDLVQSSGERVVRAGTIAAGTFYVTSFRPKNGSCESGGESWLYSLDFNDGSGKDNQDGSENNVTAGRIDSKGDGILSNPAVDFANGAIIFQNSNTTMMTQDISASVRKLTVRAWRQRY